jgi:hypothetical protein
LLVLIVIFHETVGPSAGLGRGDHIAAIEATIDHFELPVSLPFIIVDKFLELFDLPLIKLLIHRLFALRLLNGLLDFHTDLVLLLLLSLFERLLFGQ